MSRYIDADKGLRSKIQLETGCNFATADRIVESRPTADVKPVVHGKWETHHSLFTQGGTYYTCSICGDNNIYTIHYKYRYCPSCGSRMDGADMREESQCGNCEHFGTVNCAETYREPTNNDKACECFADMRGERK